MIPIPCVVDGSQISTLSSRTSCTCFCLLVCLTCHIKVIDCLMQDTWVSRYKQTGRDPLFLEPNTATKRPLIQILSVFCQLLSWLCVEMFCKRMIFCELYVDTCSDVSDYSDSESLDRYSDVTKTSSHKQLRSSTGSLTHNFHTYFSSHCE
jgi:hypothetical protein